MAQVDKLAQRYKKLPHEILSLGWGDYSINARIAHIGAEFDKS